VSHNEFEVINRAKCNLSEALITTKLHENCRFGLVESVHKPLIVSEIMDLNVKVKKISDVNAFQESVDKSTAFLICKLNIKLYCFKKH
jgi:hypothetical protein